jgi:hypothetical protein
VNHEAANAAVVDITEVTLGWITGILNHNRYTISQRIYYTTTDILYHDPQSPYQVGRGVDDRRSVRRVTCETHLWVSHAMCCFTLIVMVDVGVVMCDVDE